MEEDVLPRNEGPALDFEPARQPAGCARTMTCQVARWFIRTSGTQPPFFIFCVFELGRGGGDVSEEDVRVR